MSSFKFGRNVKNKQTLFWVTCGVLRIWMARRVEAKLLNWPLHPVSYFNFLCLVLRLSFCSVILLAWLSSWFMSYLKMTFDPQPIPHLSILPSASVLLLLLLLCLGWLMLRGSLVCMEWKHQQQAACFLICHDPPLTHFLPHSHPAPDTGSRKTNYSPGTSKPSYRKHTHTHTQSSCHQWYTQKIMRHSVKTPWMGIFCRSGHVWQYSSNPL